MPLLANIAERAFNRPLLCTPQYANIVATILHARLGVQPVLGNGEIPPGRPARLPMMDNGVLIMPVVGGLVHRGDSLDAESGAESYTHLHNLLRGGLQNEACKGILLDIDSPGGEAGGCFEFADMIKDAAKVKPIWAVANAMACSAAYMIGSSAKKFYATPSAHVGSIGVAWMHVDVSKMMAAQGVVTTLLYAGKHKIDGNPYEALSKEDKAQFQESIDKSYTLFVDSVAARRPITAEAARATEARVYRADEATELKLVDGIKSLEATLEAFHAALEKPKVKGIQPMTTTTQEAAGTITAEAHAAAIASTKAESHKAGYAAGRADAHAIMTAPEAEGKQGFAAELVRDADMPKDRAVSYLKAAPSGQATTSTLRDRMQGSDPAVGAGDGKDEPAEQARAARAAQLGKTMKAAQAR